MVTSPVNDLLALFCSTFRCELDSYQKRAYERALLGIPSDVLLAAADALIDASAAGRKFYPMPTAPEVKGAAAKVIETRRMMAFKEAIKFCDHTSQFEEVDGKMQRCSCWTRGMQAMEAVGQPVALPPWTDREVGE